MPPRHPAVLGRVAVFGGLVMAVVSAAAPTQRPTAQRADDALPPPFPRPGATKLFENQRVLVWDIAWLMRQYPLHRHIYDLVGVFYTPGDRLIIERDGTRRRVSTKAWDMPFQRAGLVHKEEGTSVEPLRAVFIELKEPAAAGQLNGGTSPASIPAFINDVLGPARVDNDRTRAWLLPADLAPTPHRHALDGVVISFRAGKPSATFLTVGTVHGSEAGRDADRAYLFELK